MVRILQVVGKMHRAGMETLIMNIYQNIDREKLQFDFCVHSDEPGEYDEEIKAFGGRIYSMPQARVSNLFKLQEAADRFFAEHRDYAAVHVHYSCVGYYYFKAAARAGISNLIYHAHNSGREPGMRAFLRYMMERQSVKKATIRFACSSSAAKYNFGNKKYIMLNNGIDTARFRYSGEKRRRIRMQYGLRDKKICIHIGRFDTQKNHSFLIDAFEKVFLINRKTELLLLGNGPLKIKIMQKLESLNCREHVHFLGNVDNVEDFLFASDVFLLPSLYEGLPLTLIEAQAAGIRCLVSDEITKEAVVVDGLVNRCSTDKAQLWAEKIIESFDYERKDTSNDVKKAGFDSKDIAEKMEKYYLILGEE